MSYQAPTSAELAVFSQHHQTLGFQSPVLGFQRRWRYRVVPNRWHLKGTAGAVAYLEKYGHRLKSQHLVGMALYAERMGCWSFATRLWRQAYILAHQGLPPAAKADAFPAFAEFPPELRPGLLRIQDGILVIRNCANRFNDSTTWGMELPKGDELIVFAANGELAYQTEEGRARTWHPTLDQALRGLDKLAGPFVLEGTAAFRDGRGNLHSQERMAKQATPGLPLTLVFVVLRAVYHNRTSLMEGSENPRQEAAAALTAHLTTLATGSPPFEVRQVQFARTYEEKRALAEKNELLGWCSHTRGLRPADPNDSELRAPKRRKT